MKLIKEVDPMVEQDDDDENKSNFSSPMACQRHASMMKSPEVVHRMIFNGFLHANCDYLLGFGTSS